MQKVLSDSYSGPQSTPTHYLCTLCTHVPQGHTALPSGHPFGNVSSEYYWTASTAPIKVDFEYGECAYQVHFKDGTVSYVGKDATRHVWCVRGGYGHDAYVR